MADKPRVWDAFLTREFIYIPGADDNKYTRGVVGLVAGSKRYPGAAILAARASLATGVGMVRFVGTPALNAMVLAAAPSVVVTPGRVDAWVLGPGVGPMTPADPNTVFRHRAMSLAYEDRLPTVLDAGGLMMPERFHPLTLLTPHSAELSSLLGSRGISASPSDIADSPLHWARRAAESLRTTVLLKGARTCVASPDKVIELPLATPWLATAGTGDVLAGVIGSLTATHARSLVEHPEYFADIAASGAFIHAAAAERASQGGPLTAETLIRELPDAIRLILAR